jgi:hypothetical protein
VQGEKDEAGQGFCGLRLVGCLAGDTGGAGSEWSRLCKVWGGKGVEWRGVYKVDLPSLRRRRSSDGIFPRDDTAPDREINR